MAVDKLDTRLFFSQKALIEKDGKVLVLRDPKCLVHGQSGLDFPGGKYRWGQSLETELKREVKDETGLQIEIGIPFYVWTTKGLKRKIKNAHVVLAGFLCKYKSGTVKLSSEHDRFEWVDKSSYKKWREDTEYYKALEEYFKLKGT